MADAISSTLSPSGLPLTRDRAAHAAATCPERRDARWSALLARAQQGNDDAYRILLAELYPWLLRMMRRRLPAMLVEDAVQDILGALHQKRDFYEPGRPFTRWIAGIARYKGIDALRAYRRTMVEPGFDDPAIGSHESAVTSQYVVDALLSRLKPAQADAIRRVKLMGYSISETSAATGQSESLVKVNVHRGLGRFAAMLSA